MSVVLNTYKKNFLKRFDKDDAIPYLSYKDFPNLTCEENSFINSVGVELKYFVYHYDQYQKDKVILFCHGIGPGHAAYMREIEYLCSHGYKVLTLDYTGCGASQGETLFSINEPTRDVIELLNLLNIQEEIVLIGHSLGGYTALNVINKINFIHKAVIISGFISTKYLVKGFIKLDLLGEPVVKYEQKMVPEYANINNIEYLKTTTDKLLFIHSKDDPMVNPEYSIDIIRKIDNPNLSFLIENDKKHNPNYTKEAVEFMNESIGVYQKLLSKNKLDTLEKRKEYFKDKTAWKMTEQDDKVWEEILSFINK